MNNVHCNIIRDLLPLYADGVVSEESRGLVEEHLAGCEACRRALEQMECPLTLPDFELSQADERSQLQQVRRRIGKGKYKAAALAVVLTLALLLGAYLGLYTQPLSAEHLVGNLENFDTVYVEYRCGETAEQGDAYALPLDSAQGRALLDLVQGQQYSRSTLNLLPREQHTYTLRPGDFAWELRFVRSSPEGPETVVRFSNAYGRLELAAGSWHARCSVENQEAWLRQVMEAIQR